MKFLLIMAIFFSGTSSAKIFDPEDCIPSIVETDYQKPGVFGDNPKYSENTLLAINCTLHLIEASESRRILVNPLVFGQGAVTVDDAIDTLSDRHLEVISVTTLDGIDPANWAGSPPATVTEAWDRVAALLKTLNADAPIP